MGIDNPVHLIFIAAVALIVLGPKRLPDLARSLGQGMREFRDSMSEAAKDDGSVTGTLVPDQAQLVAAEPVAVDPRGCGCRRSGCPCASGRDAGSRAACTSHSLLSSAREAIRRPG